MTRLHAIHSATWGLNGRDLLGNPRFLASWLFGVAIRVANRTRERSRRRVEQERLPRASSSTRPVPEEISWREANAGLQEELSRLPEKQQLPLLLCYWEGLSQEEAAQRLGIPRGTLKRRLEEGRTLLGVRLKRRGLALPALLLAGAAGAAVAWGARGPALIAATTEVAVCAAPASAALGSGFIPGAALAAVRFLGKAKLQSAGLCFIALTSAALVLPLSRGSGGPVREKAPESAMPAAKAQDVIIAVAINAAAANNPAKALEQIPAATVGRSASTMSDSCEPGEMPLRRPSVPPPRQHRQL